MEQKHKKKSKTKETSDVITTYTQSHEMKVLSKSSSTNDVSELQTGPVIVQKCKKQIIKTRTRTRNTNSMIAFKITRYAD